MTVSLTAEAPESCSQLVLSWISNESLASIKKLTVWRWRGRLLRTPAGLEGGDLETVL